MNRILLSTSLALVAAATFAANPGLDSTPAKAARKAKQPHDVYRITGGRLVDTRNMKGRIVYVNAQSRAKEEWLREHAASFSKGLRIKIDVESGTFPFPDVKLAANETALFVIDDPKYPSILAAPDQGWAAVNVAALASGDGAKPAFLEARVKKELTRALAAASGGIDSAYPNNPVGPVAAIDDLDRIADYRLAVDVTDRILKTLKARGVMPYKMSTYERACYEGWAPAPTNDVQKAIWDEVHAAPTKPIVIKPETRKR